MLRVLQAGRGLAAAGVAAFHLSVTMGVDRYGGVPVFTEFTRQGFRGVDFFFVLSGFIIFFAHFKDLGHPAAWKEYAYRRFVRVFPIYWLYTAGLVVLLLLGFGTEAKNPRVFADWLTSWTLIRFTDAAPPIGPAWTLFHEVAFYAMFSLLIFNLRLGIIALSASGRVCAPRSGNSRCRTTGLPSTSIPPATTCSSCSAWARSGFIDAVDAASTNSRPESSSRLRRPSPWTCHTDFRTWLSCCGFALLVAATTKMELAGYIKVPNFLNFIGNASYTIYLTHISIQGLLLKVAMASGFYRAAGAHADLSARAGGDHCARLPRLRADRATAPFVAAATPQEARAHTSHCLRYATARRDHRRPQYD